MVSQPSYFSGRSIVDVGLVVIKTAEATLVFFQ
jgi:hypothetical protein